MADRGQDRGVVPAPGLPRAADLAIALLVLAVTAPISIAAAIAIRLEGGGSVLYRQPRIGRGGERFRLLKFRTMHAGSDPVGLGVEVTRDDPRLTRVGALLRRNSLDELPNLINVIRGEMAIVGPRPTLESQVIRYSDRQRRRLAVRPGITGWAQVNGRTEIPWERRIELDLWYVEHRSPRLDLRIIARSLGSVLS